METNNDNREIDNGRFGPSPAHETDYEKHQDNPAPSREAIYEENDKGAGQTMKWLIPLIIAVLVVVWFFFLR